MDHDLHAVFRLVGEAPDHHFREIIIAVDLDKIIFIGEGIIVGYNFFREYTIVAYNKHISRRVFPIMVSVGDMVLYNIRIIRVCADIGKFCDMHIDAALALPVGIYFKTFRKNIGHNTQDHLTAVFPTSITGFQHMLIIQYETAVYFPEGRGNRFFCSCFWIDYITFSIIHTDCN